MIAILLPLLTLVAAILFAIRTGARWSVHAAAISAALLVIALARAASSRSASECALDFTPTVRNAVAKVPR